MADTKKTSQWSAKKTQTVVVMGLLTAIIVVLQIFAAGINIGGLSNISLVLAPIIVGAALYGWKAGAWLGMIFSAVVLLSGQASLFMAMNIPGTIITVLLKGTLAGIATPVVNTGVYFLGCLVFFADFLKASAEASEYNSLFAYIIFGAIGLNFVVELAINLVLSSAIVLILNIAQEKFNL